VGVDYLVGAQCETERERILLRQIGWIRRMLGRTVVVYGQGDKWLRGHLITLKQAVSKNHPILKRFYMQSDLSVLDVQRGEAWEIAAAERIKDALDTVGFMSSNDLADEVGLAPRNVRKVIENMVFEGHPIVATREGYKLARDASELLAYQSRLLAAARSLLERASAIGNVAHDFERGWR
jgi:biotin operon repressor